MRYFSLITLFVSLFSYANPEILRVSIFELLSKNPPIDTQKVRVIGYLQKDGNGYSLYPYKTDAKLMDSSRSLAIDTLHSEGIDLSNCANQYVQIAAIFKVSERPLPNILHSLSSVMVKDENNKYMGYSACGK